MVCATLFGHPLTWTWINSYTLPLLRVKFQNRPASVHFSLSSNIPVTNDSNQHSIHMDSLRALEWDKLCDSVASFARTSLGRQAIKVCIAAKFSFSCPWFHFSYEEHCFTFWFIGFNVCYLTNSWKLDTIITNRLKNTNLKISTATRFHANNCSVIPPQNWSLSGEFNFVVTRNLGGSSL